MWRIPLLALLLLTVAAAQDKPSVANKVPVISGDLGSCSAEFTVTDTKLKPIYNAKLEVELRYGFASLKRTNLEIYTNIDGKARVEGLPESSRRPIAVTASFEGRKTVVVVSPEEKCQGKYQAILTDRPIKSPDGDAEEEQASPPSKPDDSNR